MYMTTYSWHYILVPCLTWLPPHSKVTLFTFVWTVSLLDLILRWKLIYDQLNSIFTWFGLILAVLDFTLAWLYWILFKWILALFVPGFNRLILVWSHCYSELFLSCLDLFLTWHVLNFISLYPFCYILFFLDLTESLDLNVPNSTWLVASLTFFDPSLTWLHPDLKTFFWL